MSSGEGGQSPSDSIASGGTESIPKAAPPEEGTLAQTPFAVRPTARDVTQPGDTEPPGVRPPAADAAPAWSAFELDHVDGTQVQRDADVAASQLRSKGPCQAPGYKILVPLGAGTYGEVWLAEEERTGVRVAIKFISHGADEQWQMLQAEVRQLAQLHADPGIVQLIDAEFDSQPPYYIMAYAKQGSLAKRLEHGPLPLDEALAIFRRVAEALAYVHVKGICHCDLKPGNILLDARGRALVADFGQAHLSSDASPALGTFFYMAPEQAALDRSLPDSRWDVYGLGALAYAMLTGRAPREDPALRAKLAGTAELSHRLRHYRDSVARAPKPIAHRQVRGIDRDLIEIIDKCLEIKPEARPRDAAAVLAALAQRDRKRRQRPALIFGLVAPILLLLVMAGLVGLVFAEAKEKMRTAQEKMEDRINDRNQFIAEMVAEDIQVRLDSLMKLVAESAARKSAARKPGISEAIKNNDQARLAELLKECRNEVKGATKPHHLWIANRDGVILKLDPDIKVADISFQWRDWFNGKRDMENKQARAEPLEKTYISQPFLSTAADRPLRLIAVSTPIRDPHDPKQIVGVLGASILLEDLERWVSRLDLGRQFAVVINERGQYLSHPSKEEINPKDGVEPRRVPDDSVLHERVLPDRKPGKIGTPFTDPINQKSYLASYAPLKDGWVVLMQQEHKSESGSLQELNRSMLTISLIAVAVMGVLIPLLWGWLIWMVRREEDVAHG